MSAPTTAKHFTCPFIRLLQSMQSITEVAEKNEMWQGRQIFSNFLIVSVSSFVKLKDYIISKTVSMFDIPWFWSSNFTAQ